MLSASRRYVRHAIPLHTIYMFSPSSVSRQCSHLHGTSRENVKGSSSSAVPQTFLSLYRLLLRSTAASVLAQPNATSQLRSLWRPVFSCAAGVMAKYETKRPSRNRRIALNDWLYEWDKRSERAILPENVMFDMLSWPYHLPSIHFLDAHFLIGNNGTPDAQLLRYASDHCH